MSTFSDSRCTSMKAVRVLALLLGHLDGLSFSVSLNKDSSGFALAHDHLDDLRFPVSLGLNEDSVGFATIASVFQSSAFSSLALIIQLSPPKVEPLPSYSVSKKPEGNGWCSDRLKTAVLLVITIHFPPE